MNTYRYAQVGALDTEDAPASTHDDNNDNGTTVWRRFRQRAEWLMRRLTVGSAAMLAALIVAVVAIAILAATVRDMQQQQQQWQQQQQQRLAADGLSAWPRPSTADLACDCSVGGSGIVSSSSSTACPSVCVMYYCQHCTTLRHRDRTRWRRCGRLHLIDFPQWHPTPENSRRHGFGHTDWDLLRHELDQLPDVKALRDDDIHGASQWMQQPGELGYYNALNKQTRKRQGELLWSHGGHGFIFHIYWFKSTGLPMFEDFFRLLLLDGYPAVPFYFNWASEDWSLVGFQWRMCEADESQRRDFWNWVKPFFMDPRYMRVDNKPIFSLYRWYGDACAPLLASLRSFAYESRAETGFSDLYIVRVLAHFDKGPGTPPMHSTALTVKSVPALATLPLAQPAPMDFDAVQEFLPNACGVWHTRDASMRLIGRQRMHPVHWRGVPANWDNRPRLTWSKSKQGRYHPLHPHLFELNFRGVMQKTVADLHPPGVPNIITVNGWNEWSEGSVMEPSRQTGTRMLEKVHRSVVPDYRGVFCVLLPVRHVNDAAAVSELSDAITRLLAALDDALASTPEPVQWARGGPAPNERTRLFDYELLPFLIESPAELETLTPMRNAIRRINHPRLRFVDTPPNNMKNNNNNNTAASSSASSSSSPSPLFPPSLFSVLLPQCMVYQSSDWLLLLPLSHSTAAGSVEHLARLSTASRGQLLPFDPPVTQFGLRHEHDTDTDTDAAHTQIVHRFDFIEMDVNKRALGITQKY